MSMTAASRAVIVANPSRAIMPEEYRFTGVSISSSLISAKPRICGILRAVVRLSSPWIDAR